MNPRFPPSEFYAAFPAVYGAGLNSGFGHSTGKQDCQTEEQKGQ